MKHFAVLDKGLKFCFWKKTSPDECYKFSSSHALVMLGSPTFANEF